MIEKYCISPNITMLEAMKCIDKGGWGIAFAIDDDMRVIGALTDGDIRRWIIKNGDVNAVVDNAINRNAVVLHDYEKGKARNLLKQYAIVAIPIVDDSNRIVDIIFANDSITINRNSLENIPVIIMAGGKGTRLYPYTKVLPKPLIPIGEEAIIDRIMNQFAIQGAKDFYLTINYKKELIKAYFLDKKDNVKFLEEDEPLGTAGGIGLLDIEYTGPLLITNCDTIVNISFNELLSYHKTQKNMMTIVGSLKNIQIPYGVLRCGTGGKVETIDEKPNRTLCINTGMYIIDTECLKLIPKNCIFNMNELIGLLLKMQINVGMFPVSEDSFYDMGEFTEMSRMEQHFLNT